MARGKSTKLAKKDKLPLRQRKWHLPVPLPNNRLGRWLGKERRLGAPRYFRDSFIEIRKVIWPGRKEAWKLTFAVIVFTLVLTLFTAVLDFGLGKAVERIFL